MRLLLLGCTGFIGRELIPQLVNAGHQLTVVSRKSTPQLNKALPTNELICLQLDPSDPNTWEQEPLLKALTDAEGVINLAGEPIAEKRWSNTHRQTIRNSRLNTTKALIAAIGRLKRPPRVLINASAIGYYGTSPNAEFTEQSPSGEDFLASLCKQWEALATNKPRSTRLIVFRIGIVLGPNGGALGKMLPVFKAGLGGPIGNGKQWMSWIHRTDLCQIMQEALTHKAWSGIINAVAPEPVSMATFAITLGKILGRPSIFPVPGPILKLLLGDGARVVLEGQKVSSIKLDKLGYNFKYKSLNEAITAATISIPN